MKILIALLIATQTVRASVYEPLPDEISILGIFPQSGGWPGGKAAIPAFELAMEEINNNTEVLPNTKLVGVTVDDACTKSGGVTAPLSQCGPLSPSTGCTKDKYFDVIVGSGCSSSCGATARLAEAWSVPQVSWACTSPSLSNTADYPWFVRAVSSNRIIVDALLGLLNDKKWLNLGVIVENNDIFLSTRDYLVQQAGVKNVTIEASTTFSVEAEEADTITSIRARLNTIRITGVRVWAMAAYAISSRLILKEAKKLGMTGEGWQVILFGSIEDCLLPNPQCPGADGKAIRETDVDIMEATRGAISFIPAKPTGAAFEKYQASMVERENLASAKEILTWAVYAYEAVHSVAYSLHEFNKNPRQNQTTRELFYETLKKTSFEGTSGWYEYDSNGDRAQKYQIINFKWDDYEKDIAQDAAPWTQVAAFELLGANKGVKYTDEAIMYTAGQTKAPEAMPATSDTMPMEVRLMGIFPQSGGWPGGKAAIPAFELALEEINADPSILPDTTLVGVTADDACTKSGGITAPLSQCGPLSAETGCVDKYFDVIVGSGCSSSCGATARLAEAWKVPQVSWACTSPSLSNTKDYPWFVRAVSSNRIIVDAAVTFMVEQNWDHVATIVESSADLFVSTRDYFLTRTALKNIKVIADESFSEAAEAEDTRKSIVARLESIKRTGVRVWATFAYAGNTRTILKEAKKLGMTGEGWQVLLMGSIEDCLLANPTCPGTDGVTTRETDKDVIAAARGGIFFVPAVPKGKAFDDYQTKMIARQDDVTSADQLLTWAVYAYEATHQIAKALNSFGKNPRLHRDDFYATLKNTSYMAPSGWYEYDSNGDRAQKYQIVNFKYTDYEKDIAVDKVPWTQVAAFELLGANKGVKYTDEAIMFSGGATKPCKAVGVIPENRNVISETSRSIGLALNAFNVATGVFFVLWTFIMKKQKPIKASQPAFLAMVAIGACLSSSTIISLQFEDTPEVRGWPSIAEAVAARDGNSSFTGNPTADRGCMNAVWLYCLGFVFTFAPLFAKLWRVKKIFGNTTFKVVKIKSSQLVGMIVGVMAVDTIIVVLWEVMDPLVYVRTTTFFTQTGAPLESVGTCTAQNAWSYLSIIVVFHIACLIFGNITAYQGRSIPTAYSEGKWISIAMVSNLQVFALGIPVLIITADQPEASFFVRCGVIFLNDFSVLCLIFLPKMLAIHFPDKFSNMASTERTSATLGTSSTSSNSIQPSK